MSENFRVVTAWHNPHQKEAFLQAWGITKTMPDYLILQWDEKREGCARTKNKGIRKAIDQGAEYIIVLDDDCYPAPPNDSGYPFEVERSLHAFANQHIVELQPKDIKTFFPITSPPSRGTPYHNRKLKTPVIASMGYWEEVPDYDAVGQLAYGPKHPMTFEETGVAVGVFFAFSGMNVAFHADLWPWCQFINVPRFDDIWLGFLLQKKAIVEGKCFSLAGPRVRHSRQSNVWQNLRDEALNIERNETLWSDIATGPLLPYEEMLARYGLTV